MDIIYDKNQVIIEGLMDFDIAETFECGQCFRWNKCADGSYVGVAFGRVLRIAKNKNRIVMDTSLDDFNKIWYNYFDFKVNYNKIKAKISCMDQTLREACCYAPGIRILRQDPWEALCSFIISQNNNIPRIKGIVERLCRNFGCEVAPGYFSFPTNDRLAALNQADFASIRCGFRDRYILDAARKTCCGAVNLEKVRQMPIDDARAELMKISGVGPKVAECTLLYGLHRLEAFPVDVWMKRAIGAFFPGWSVSDFGPYAGVAQQYIFYYSRMNPDLVK